MKRFTFTLLLLFALASFSFGQNQVRDGYPDASISVIDNQSGQQYIVTSDDAILFKDAFVSLVVNTQTARMHNARAISGHKTVAITQADPQANGNAFQLNLQNTFLGQTTVIYSFLYNVDQNTLYYYNPSSRNWVPEPVQGNNVINLNNCLAYGKFNSSNGQAAAGGPGDNQGGDNSEFDGPVDNDVTAEAAPPPLPEYQQPECPQEGYLWQPGYWAFSPVRSDYYWVPGVWVSPPTVGYLWTPPYWGFFGGRYMFHAGYWGSRVGFYGGINYGYGYVGVGFVGGEWHENHFRYNTAVVRVNTVVVHNTYVNTTVINRTTVVNNRVSFNGAGGVTARPTQNEIAAASDKHVMATAAQNRNQQLARSDHAQFASANHGAAPANLAAPKPPERSAFNNVNPRNSGSPAQKGNANNSPANSAPGGVGQHPNGAGSAGVNPNPQGNGGQHPNPSGNMSPRPGEQGQGGANPGGQGAVNPKPNSQAPAGVTPGAQGIATPRPNTQAPAGTNPGGQGNVNPKPNGQGQPGNRQGGFGNGGGRGQQKRNNNQQPKQPKQPKEQKKDNKKE